MNIRNIKQYNQLQISRYLSRYKYLETFQFYFPVTNVSILRTNITEGRCTLKEITRVRRVEFHRMDELVNHASPAPSDEITRVEGID